MEMRMKKEREGEEGSQVWISAGQRPGTWAKVSTHGFVWSFKTCRMFVLFHHLIPQMQAAQRCAHLISVLAYAYVLVWSLEFQSISSDFLREELYLNCLNELSQLSCEHASIILTIT